MATLGCDSLVGLEVPILLPEPSAKDADTSPDVTLGSNADGSGPDGDVSVPEADAARDAFDLDVDGAIVADATVGEEAGLDSGDSAAVAETGADATMDGPTFECSSAAMCTPGLVCCAVSGGIYGSQKSACLSGCPTVTGLPPLQLCSSTSECLTSSTCGSPSPKYSSLGYGLLSACVCANLAVGLPCPPTDSGVAEDGGDGGPDAGATIVTVPLTPDTSGAVAPGTNSVGIQGPWYAYGDGWGAQGAPPGVCETAGMHSAAQCSSITFPPAQGSNEAGTGDAGADAGAYGYPQTVSGTMCLSGVAAQVLSAVAPLSGPDYSNMFGIGTGLDFDNQGGVRAAYAATDNHVIGFSFHLSGVPAGGVRVELPTTDTVANGNDSYAIQAPVDGDYVVDLTTQAADPHHLHPSFTPGPGQPAFVANDLLSIQFHVATNITAPIPVADLCVSNLAALVQP